MSKSRVYIIQGLFIFVSILFSLRLFFLQIVDDSYKKAAENNIIQEEIQYPFRGLILARNNELLVTNKPMFDLLIIPNEVKNIDTLRFCTLIGISKAYFKQNITKAKLYSYVKPSIFIKQVSLEDFSKFSDYLDEFPGFILQPRIIRSYSHPILSNALGYISEIDRTELLKDTSHYYYNGDYIGKSGLEASYEKKLRGQRGKSYKIRNVRGVEKGKFKDGKYDILPAPGLSITSTIDIKLQKYAEKLMQHKSGSIVAIEPATGEILAIVSSPSYNPSLLTGKKFAENFEWISKDSLDPFFNRPLMAAYRPGSIFKIVQSLIALQEGLITSNTKIKCNTNLIGCHNGVGHNVGVSENLLGAIKNSCNPYFYKVMQMMIMHGEPQKNPDKGIKIALDKWSNSIKSLGFGAPLGVDLPGEKGGFIPNANYYDKAYKGRKWKYSNIYSLSIGEGENLVVPIQMANFAAIVANRGYYYTPHLIKSVGSTNQPLAKFLKKIKSNIDSLYFEVVIEAMSEVVKSGTGQYKIKLKDIEVCGKTGTVQNKKKLDHSVFIAFAPRKNPKIAVSVYVENAGQGARAAAAIAGLLVEKYIKKDSATLKFESYVLKGDFR